MKTFFMILLFGKTVLLTGQPVTVTDKDLLIKFDKPIEAITDGASLFVDVTHMFPSIQDGKLSKIRKDVGDTLKGAIIIATLKGDKGENNFSYNGGVSIGKDDVLICLVSSEKITARTWGEVEIKSSIKLENINLLWKNYKK